MTNSTATPLNVTTNGNEQKGKLKSKIAMFFSVIAIALFAFTSCDTYPEGPLISLVSKTDRVANNWKVAQAFDNGTDVTADFNQYELNLAKNGIAELTAKYVFLGVNFDYTTNGTWSFVSDSEKISFNYENNSADGVYQILKLKTNEMWLKEDGGTLELHCVTQ